VRGTREKAPKTFGLAWLLGIACFQRRLMEKHMHKQDPEEEKKKKKKTTVRKEKG
jgi:hypothetical protein